MANMTTEVRNSQAPTYADGGAATPARPGPVAKMPLSGGLKAWGWFNVLALVAHIAVWWTVHPPIGYQLRTDGHGGGPGDGLIVLVYVLFLFFPALLINASTLVATIIYLAKERRREALVLFKMLLIWLAVGVLEVLI